MKFWDSSALMPLLVKEAGSANMISLAEADPYFTVWWGARVECASALSRLEREGRLDLNQLATAFQGLNELADSWREIEPTDAVRFLAERLLRVHNLRAGDSLQLAAAISASEGYPSTMEFVCLDDRLNAAASREGFRIVNSILESRT